MPMTQAKAQELLTQYKPKLDSVKLRDDDKKNSIVESFIPNLLKALQVIANPSATPAVFDHEQTVLVSSVAQKKGWSQTTLEYLDGKYMSQDVNKKGYVNKAFIKLQDEIREGLKAEAVAEVSPAVEEPAAIAPEPVVTTPEVEPEGIDDGESVVSVIAPAIEPEGTGDDASVASSMTSEGKHESTVTNILAANPTSFLDKEKNEDRKSVGSDLSANDFLAGSPDQIDWALWLQRGALTVCFVASLAACVVAAMTLNPLLGGVGVAATVISGFALAKSFGFFNNNSDNCNDDDSSLGHAAY